MVVNDSPYLVFERASWQDFKKNTPLPLSEGDIEKLQGQYESVSLEEVIQIYLPISRLLNLYVTAAQQLFQVTSNFLGHPGSKVPYIIGVSGSVAVGKSTTSRVLKALLSHSMNHSRVEIVTTDSFLYPTRILEKRGILDRKGFPESYNLCELIRFLTDLKAGRREISVPVYSHQLYDIIEGMQLVDQPDIVILEGLNILQDRSSSLKQSPRLFVTDYCDFTIYVDAATETIKRWYLDRFLKFRRAAVNRPDLFLYPYAQISQEKALSRALEIWTSINELNLKENILPFRERAKLILEKGDDHAVKRVYLRKI